MTTRLFHISDVHLGIVDRTALDAVAKAVRDEQPDLLVCTGDITQRAKRSEYHEAKTWFASLGVPVWIDPGNHDMPYFNLFERFSDPYGRYRRLKDGVAIDHFETADVVLMPLKTTVRAQARWPWSDGHVTKSAETRTLAALRRYQGDPRHRVVTAHHPLHGPEVDGPTSTIRGNEALAELARSGMDAVMTGHIHKPFNEFRSGHEWSTQVIGAGTLSTRLRHGAPPSYNVLTCRKGDDEIHVEVREL